MAQAVGGRLHFARFGGERAFLGDMEMDVAGGDVKRGTWARRAELAQYRTIASGTMPRIVVPEKHALGSLNRGDDGRGCDIPTLRQDLA